MLKSILTNISLVSCIANFAVSIHRIINAYAERVVVFAWLLVNGSWRCLVAFAWVAIRETSRNQHEEDIFLPPKKNPIRY